MPACPLPLYAKSIQVKLPTRDRQLAPTSVLHKHALCRPAFHSFLQEAVQNQVSHAIHSCVEQVVSPFLHQAADAMQDATAMLERVPSAALEKAFSKSLVSLAAP